MEKSKSLVDDVLLEVKTQIQHACKEIIKKHLEHMDLTAKTENRSCQNTKALDCSSQSTMEEFIITKFMELLEHPCDKLLQTLAETLKKFGHTRRFADLLISVDPRCNFSRAPISNREAEQQASNVNLSESLSNDIVRTDELVPPKRDDPSSTECQSGSNFVTDFRISTHKNSLFQNSSKDDIQNMMNLNVSSNTQHLKNDSTKIELLISAELPLKCKENEADNKSSFITGYATSTQQTCTPAVTPTIKKEKDSDNTPSACAVFQDDRPDLSFSVSKDVNVANDFVHKAFSKAMETDQVVVKSAQERNTISRTARPKVSPTRAKFQSLMSKLISSLEPAGENSLKSSECNNDSKMEDLEKSNLDQKSSDFKRKCNLSSVQPRNLRKITDLSAGVKITDLSADVSVAKQHEHNSKLTGNNICEDFSTMPFMNGADKWMNETNKINERNSERTTKEASRKEKKSTLSNSDVFMGVAPTIPPKNDSEKLSYISQKVEGRQKRAEEVKPRLAQRYIHDCLCRKQLPGGNNFQREAKSKIGSSQKRQSSTPDEVSSSKVPRYDLSTANVQQNVPTETTGWLTSIPQQRQISEPTDLLMALKKNKEAAVQMFAKTMGKHSMEK